MYNYLCHNSYNNILGVFAKLLYIVGFDQPPELLC